MEKFVKVVTIIVLVILIPIIFVNGVIIADSVIHPDEVPSFFGWKPFIVLSGSMETDICAGDIVVVKEVDTSKLKENDIIAFREENIVITHRIVKIENVNGVKHYIKKGDRICHLFLLLYLKFILPLQSQYLPHLHVPVSQRSLVCPEQIPEHDIRAHGRR